MSNLAIKAQASTNFSNPATWVGGVVPGLGDTAYANGYTVVIDAGPAAGTGPTVAATALVAGVRYKIVSVGTTVFTTYGATYNFPGVFFTATGAATGTGTAQAITTLTNAVQVALGAVVGGGFSCTAAITIYADIVHMATTPSALVISGSNATTIVGDIRNSGGSATTHGVSNTSSGTLTVVGDIYGGTVAGGYGLYQNAAAGALSIVGRITGAASDAVRINAMASASVVGSMQTSTGAGAGIYVSAASGTLTFVGDVYGSQISGGVGIFNNSTANLVISGNVRGGIGHYSYAVYNNSTGGVTINGSVRGGSGAQAFGVYSNGSGEFVVTGDVYASEQANGFYAISSSIHTIKGSTYDHANGSLAIQAYRYKLNTTPTNAVRRVALDGVSTFAYFYTADTVLAHAAIGDVRAGTTYGLAGALTGTLTLPAASSVALGVAVGGATGTAALTAAVVRQAAAQSR